MTDDWRRVRSRRIALVVVAVWLGLVQLAGMQSARLGFSALFIGAAILAYPALCRFQHWLEARRDRPRLIADADLQHEAWKRGDDQLAFFGRYQPAVPPVVSLHADALEPMRVASTVEAMYRAYAGGSVDIRSVVS